MCLCVCVCVCVCACGEHALYKGEKHKKKTHAKPRNVTSLIDIRK